MSTIFLVDRADDRRKLRFIFICDLRGTIPGRSVINDQNLHILPSNQQGVNTFSHILFRIITGNCYGK